jgi:methyltransferase (TIGR00027 family)
MRDTETPSGTAPFVAAFRSYAKWLPEPLASLAPDPYGAPFAGGAYARLDALLNAAPPALARAVARFFLGRGATALALRTRTLDDAVRAFHAGGGRQAVLLGAGLDARAWRLRELRECTVLEVDSPGSQRAKLAAIARTHAAPPPALRFVAHDFEAERMEALPQKLRDAGLDTAAPTLTIWEGVVMYLSEGAVAGTVAAVRAFGGDGSQLAFTYLAAPAQRTRWQRIAPWFALPSWAFWLLAARTGEYFIHSFDPVALPGWLKSKGWSLRWDKDYADIAADVGVPPALLRRFLPRVVNAGGMSHRFALAALDAGADAHDG